MKERALTLPVAPAPLPEQPAPLEDQLVRQWAHYAYTIASDFYLPGSDIEDVKQEALVGLLRGLRGHDPARGPLKTFLAMSIRRQLITAVKRERRQKHLALNESARRGLDTDGETVEIVDLLEAADSDPHERLILRLRLAAIVCGIGRLSDLERRWLFASINEDGWSHRDGCVNKTADNAVQRARRKLREAA